MPVLSACRYPSVGSSRRSFGPYRRGARGEFSFLSYIGGWIVIVKFARSRLTDRPTVRKVIFQRTRKGPPTDPFARCIQPCTGKGTNAASRRELPYRGWYCSSFSAIPRRGSDTAGSGSTGNVDTKNARIFLRRQQDYLLPVFGVPTAYDVPLSRWEILSPSSRSALLAVYLSVNDSPSNAPL